MRESQPQLAIRPRIISALARLWGEPTLFGALDMVSSQPSWSFDEIASSNCCSRACAEISWAATGVAASAKTSAIEVRRMIMWFSPATRAASARAGNLSTARDHWQARHSS